jgi:hypothetical protein
MEEGGVLIVKTSQTEESTTISCTPEGESYFKKQAEALFDRVNKGDFDDLDVEITNYELEPSSSASDLVVKPLFHTASTEVEVMDLTFEPGLIVKPIELSVRPDPFSSYEAIYDKVSLEETSPDQPLTTAEILSKLGDKFHGTHQFPDKTASFEELYQDNKTITIVDSVEQSRRWTAPENTVEPPILEQEEFDSRFGAVQGKIDHHWDQIEVLMNVERQCGEGSNHVIVYQGDEDPITSSYTGNSNQNGHPIE